MALAGTSLIAGLSLLLILLTAVPGGSSGLPGTSSSLKPGSPAGPSCVAKTGDLLCWEKTRSQRNGQTIHDPLISIEGPGTFSVKVPGLMIDGDPQTSWVSAGDATGAVILLEFNEPVIVGTVGIMPGMAAAGGTSVSSPGKRVIGVTWSFAEQDGSSNRPCGASGDEFGEPIHQDLSQRPNMEISPAIQTCTVRIQIERVATAEAGGGSSPDVAISELTLLSG
jgi:hypothetical protein